MIAVTVGVFYEQENESESHKKDGSGYNPRDRVNPRENPQPGRGFRPLRPRLLPPRHQGPQHGPQAEKEAVAGAERGDDPASHPGVRVPIRGRDRDGERVAGRGPAGSGGGGRGVGGVAAPELDLQESDRSGA